VHALPPRQAAEPYAPDPATVSSEFYPDLRRYYEAEAAQWLEQRPAEYASEEDEEEDVD
jgi:hypothetical protein